MRTTNVPIQPLRSTGAVKLGRFIVSKDEPQLAFIDPEITHAHEPLIIPQQGIDRTSLNVTTDSMGVRAAGIIHGASANSVHQGGRLIAQTGREYKLNNAGGWFNTAMGKEDVRTWLKNNRVSTGSIYLVIGYRTVFDAALQQAEEIASQRSGSLGIHGSGTHTDGTAESLPGAAIATGTTDKSRVHQIMHAPGEQVAEVQVCKLKFKPLSNFMDAAMKATSLEGTSQWRSVSHVTGSEVTDRLFEVSLETESDYSESEAEDEEI